MRKVLLAAATAVLVMGGLQQRASAAHPVSRHNPYRAFNHTGINYGAQQWERRNRSSGWSAGQGYVRSGQQYGTSGIVGAPSGRWSYGSAYRGTGVATPVAPCR